MHVRLLPSILNPATLADETPDRFEYFVPSQREQRTDRGLPPGLRLLEGPEDFRARRRSAELALPLRSATWEPASKVYTSREDHVLHVFDKSDTETHVIDESDPALEIRKVRDRPGDGVRTIDVSSTTQGRGRVASVTTALLTPARLPHPLQVDPGPAALDRYGKLALFVSPSTGRVGAVDMESEETFGVADVGGYPSDLVVDRERGKAYVCDAVGRRLVVLDAQTLRREADIALPAMPLSMAMAEGGRELFVACRTDKCLAVVDVEKGEVTRIKVLPARPYELHMVRLMPGYTCFGGGRWPWHNYRPADSEAPERLLVCLSHPTTFDADTLRPFEGKAAGDDTTRRGEAEAGGKVFRAEVGAAMICVDGERCIDVAGVADPRRWRDAAKLRGADRAGTITMAVDGGPEHCWKRDVWVAPDSGLHLVDDTQEFRRWNAPAFAVGPGKHVLRVRARGPQAKIEGVEVTLAPAGGISLRIAPEPAPVHGAIGSSSYGGTFYDEEEVRFGIEIGSQGHAAAGTLRSEVLDLAGKVVAREERAVEIEADGTLQGSLAFGLSEWGVHRLVVTYAPDGPEAEVREERLFVRVPKLEHPRLLFRREATAAIEARVAGHGRLFARWARWLRRHCDDEGFLPTTLLAKFSERGEYLDVLAKWRVLACQFAAMFVEGSEDLQAKAASFLEPGYADEVTFAHNWFRAALAMLYDLAAADDPSVAAKIGEVYDGAWADLDRIEEALLSLREPLTACMRVSLHQQATWLANVDRYFSAHAGASGGNLYVSPSSLCVCPIFGTLGALILYRNVFGMRRLLERPYVGGWFRHYRGVMPARDPEGFFAHGAIETGGPITGAGCMDVKTMVDAVAMLAREPVEKRLRGWDAWYDEAEAADTSDARAEEMFATGVGAVMPLFLALDWYDRDAPEAALEDLPTAAYFDGEGEVVMRSGRDEQAAEVYFACGARDVVTRHHAGHVQIVKAGRVLMGSPAARLGDHAQPVPSWANTVVVGDEWAQWWMRSVGHPCGCDQHIILNRFALDARVQEARAQAILHGRLPAPVSEDQCYFLGFSEHTQNPYVREGEIVSFETGPHVNTATGDMTNAWPAGQVLEAYRQVRFLKPDVIVIHDRITLGADLPTRWLAAMWRELEIDGAEFRVRNASANLAGRVLLPVDAVLSATSTADYGNVPAMPLLEVRPETGVRSVEYLVAMRVGEGGAVEAPDAEEIERRLKE